MTEVPHPNDTIANITLHDIGNDTIFGTLSPIRKIAANNVTMLDYQADSFRATEYHSNANNSIPVLPDDEQLLLSIPSEDLKPTVNHANEWKEVVSKKAAKNKTAGSPPMSSFPHLQVLPPDPAHEHSKHYRSGKRQQQKQWCTKKTRLYISIFYRCRQ